MRSLRFLLAFALFALLPSVSMAVTPPAGYAHASQITLTAGASALTTAYTAEVDYTTGTTLPVSTINSGILAYTVNDPNGVVLDSQHYPSGYPSDLTVWYNGTQIDAEVAQDSAASVIVRFKLQAAIAASATDSTGYVLAWGNASPTVKDTLLNVYMGGSNFSAVPTQGSTAGTWVFNNMGAVTVASNVLSLTVSANSLGAIYYYVPGSTAAAFNPYTILVSGASTAAESTWNANSSLGANSTVAGSGAYAFGYGTNAGNIAYFSQNGVGYGSTYTGLTTLAANTYEDFAFKVSSAATSGVAGKIWTPGQTPPAYFANTAGSFTAQTGTYAGLFGTLVGTTGVVTNYRTFRVEQAVASDPTVTSGAASVAAASITASPSTLTASGGAQSAVVTGTNTAFSTSSTTQFTLSGGTGASIVSQSASTGTAAALSINPGTAAGTLTLTDTTDGATTTITVVAVAVSVSPSAASVNVSGTQQYAATVTGNGTGSSAVTWTVTGGSANGTITSGGLYTAPATAGTYTIVATSVLDGTKSGSATANVSSATPPTAPAAALDNSGTTDSIVVYTPSTPGTYALTGYALYRGATAGGESATALATSANGVFTGLAKGAYFYRVRSYDNQGTPNYSVNSAELQENLGGVSDASVAADVIASLTAQGFTSANGTKLSALTVDGSGRVLLQPVQTGVTIPTVTSLTNPVVASSVTGTVTLASGDEIKIGLIGTDTSGVTALLGRPSQTGDLYALLSPLIVSSKFSVAALSNAPTSSGGASAAAVAALILANPNVPINNDPSGYVKLQPAEAFANSTAGTVAPTWYTAPPSTVTVGGYATGQDPATLILGASLYPGLTLATAWGDTWATDAGPSTATHPDTTHQVTVYTTPAGAGQHTTTLNTTVLGVPVSRTVTHP